MYTRALRTKPAESGEPASTNPPCILFSFVYTRVNPYQGAHVRTHATTSAAVYTGCHGTTPSLLTTGFLRSIWRSLPRPEKSNSTATLPTLCNYTSNEFYRETKFNTLNHFPSVFREALPGFSIALMKSSQDSWCMRKNGEDASIRVYEYTSTCIARRRARVHARRVQCARVSVHVHAATWSLRATRVCTHGRLRSAGVPRDTCPV